MLSTNKKLFSVTSILVMERGAFAVLKGFRFLLKKKDLYTSS